MQASPLHCLEAPFKVETHAGGDQCRTHSDPGRGSKAANTNPPLLVELGATRPWRRLTLTCHSGYEGKVEPVGSTPVSTKNVMLGSVDVDVDSPDEDKSIFCTFIPSLKISRYLIRRIRVPRHFLFPRVLS